jgi:site-specific recombinase XerD
MTETAILIPTTHPAEQTLLVLPLATPRIVEQAGPAAAFAWDEFFRGSLRNPHTRTAYSRAVRGFLGWLETHGIPLAQVTPGIVGSYFDHLGGSAPTKKLALAALRRFFDILVIRHVMLFNPALSVRGERYSVVEGKTPAIPIDQARSLLASINIGSPSGLRDRAVLATLIYTALRASAAANLRLKDFVYDGTQYSLKFTEKGGKDRNLPVRHDLERYLLEYLAVAVKDGEPKTAPLFRTLAGRTGEFTSNAMTGTDIWRMTKRRLKDAGLSSLFSPHSFRAATCTDLLEQGMPLADVQYLLGHADPRTTRLYDRRSRSVSRNLVERISV